MSIKDIRIGDEVTLYFDLVSNKENYKTDVIGICKNYAQDNGRKVGNCIFIQNGDQIGYVNLNSIKEVNGQRVYFNDTEKYINSMKDETLLVTSL